MRIRSRNFSCRELREIETRFTTIYRMGSTTPLGAITRVPRVIEINSIDGCSISSNKIAMKKRFWHAHIRTPKFYLITSEADPEGSFFDKTRHMLTKWRNGVIAKRYNSSKGHGIFIIRNEEDIESFMEMIRRTHDYYHKWIFERFSTYSREYRLHCTRDGCFYACRKMLKNDADVRWHRHDENSVWITEQNELFERPECWDDLVTDCVNALKALNLDIAAFDVKVQSTDSSIERKPDWVQKYLILEVNTAPGLGEVGLQKYKETLPLVIDKKIETNSFTNNVRHDS